MVQNLIVGAIVGGIVAFTWGAISWMVLPWHHTTFLRFRDEDAVARAIAENAPRSGVYGFPGTPDIRSGMSAEERKAAETAAWEKMKAGPILFAVVQREGFGSLTFKMLSGFAIGVVASLILTWLLLNTTGLSYLGRATFVALAAFGGAVLCRLPDWNWHGFSTPYTAVLLADAAIGWFLTGLAIAAVVRPATGS